MLGTRPATSLDVPVIVSLWNTFRESPGSCWLAADGHSWIVGIGGPTGAAYYGLFKACAGWTQESGRTAIRGEVSPSAREKGLLDRLPITFEAAGCDPRPASLCPFAVWRRTSRA